MDKEKIEIRIANTSDLGKIIELHLLSFSPDNNIPVLIGKRFVASYQRWLVKSKIAYTLVATINNEIVAMVSVCDRSFTTPIFIACLPELVLSLILKPKLIFKKQLWTRLFREASIKKDAGKAIRKDGFAQMVIGAVASKFRGQGVFPDLLQATKQYSLDRGSWAIRAGVYKGNMSSSRVFSKCGWIEWPELETNNTIYFVCQLKP